MQQRIPSVLDPPIMFAHRGARAHAQENTIDAFRLALRLGATGLESDVWRTADGVLVLDHDGEVRRGRLRKQPISAVRRDELPEHIPTLTELIDACGTGYHLSLDLKDEAAGPAVIELVRSRAPELLDRLWLCHPDVDALVELRPLDDTVKLVDSTRLERIGEGPERRAARLAKEGVDGINLRQPDWNGGLVTLFHRFGLTAFSWDLQFDHVLRPAFRMGIDAVYSDHVDRMVDAFQHEIGTGP
ncbi:MAG: glycerophosphodiester phosphodiesterase [Ilumatobacter sp.]|uniref:glycerophosphodiester phosphodiesterase n=1 Tax=Ilumatobacter sp. TaxID=1967498 RepID=UPI0026102674|nr:glycerophosphodiester phosphodiesterase [Ilumatobacter sp.]MDJ0771457.1 glycerophosphodiester phosphodiesterase [Ilumatobacter sp.]